MQIYRYMVKLMLKFLPYLQRNSLQLPKLNCNIGLAIFYFQILLPRECYQGRVGHQADHQAHTSYPGPSATSNSRGGLARARPHRR